MKRLNTLWILTGGVTLIATIALAQSAPRGVYDLTWHSIDGGGGTSSGGDYSLHGTIGQHDASAPMTGGNYSLTSGFWSAPGTDIETCLADIDESGAVNVSDLLALLSAWGTCDDCAEDLNNDDVVDVTDLLELLGAWGTCQ